MSGKMITTNQSMTQIQMGNRPYLFEFMLTTIKDALNEITSNAAQKNVGMNDGINVGIKKNSQEEKLLKILQNNPYITAKELALELSISQRQVERIILRMKQDNIIERVGARRNGYWKINKQRGARQ